MPETETLNGIEGWQKSENGRVRDFALNILLNLNFLRKEKPLQKICFEGENMTFFRDH